MSSRVGPLTRKIKELYPDYLFLDEFAKLKGLSYPSQVSSLMSCGRLKGLKRVGNRWLIHKDGEVLPRRVF